MIDNSYLKEQWQIKGWTLIPLRQLPVLVIDGQSVFKREVLLEFAVS